MGPENEAGDLVLRRIIGKGRFHEKRYIAMGKKIVRSFVWAFFFALLCSVAAATENPSVESEPERISQQPVRTNHVLEIAGKVLSYTATAGAVTVKTQKPIVEGQIFFVSYTLDEKHPNDRPVTFAFNGGPGAASAYLHLGALGPGLLVLNDDGSIPPPPNTMIDNEHTWLQFTDLVFIDPVGTGYSRGLSKKEEDDRAFWGVEQDARTVGEFIRLFLSRNNRWGSPKFLVGESYGGVRAATLAHLLHSADFGIGLNGIVFVSPVLEYSLTRQGTFNVLPWVAVLPSYAAAALYHNRSTLNSASTDFTRALEVVEQFAVDTYLPAITKGGRLSRKMKVEIYQDIAGFIGLPYELVERYDGRVPFFVFSRELLRDEKKVTSVYDTSLATADPDPSAPFYDPESDSAFIGMVWPLTAAFGQYVRTHLKFETDLPYKLLNQDLNGQWDWTTGIGGDQGFVTTAGGLESALEINPALKIFVAHGYYDLVTSYFATRFVFDQMNLARDLANNITMKCYRGGHMLYTHRNARETFFADVREFYRNAVSRN